MKAQKFNLPNALTIMTGFIAVAIALTYIITPGQYERSTDEVTGQVRVVPGWLILAVAAISILIAIA